MRHAWKTLDSAEKRNCLLIEDSLIVETFAQGRERLVARIEAEGREDSFRSILKRTGTMDVIVDAVGLGESGRTRRVLRAPEAWAGRPDFPTMLLQLLPRSYAAYQEHLRMQVFELARVCLEADMWEGQTDEEICVFLARSFYIQVFFQILSGPNPGARFHNDASCPPTGGRRRAKIAKVQAARTLAESAAKRLHSSILRGWRDTAVRLRALRRVFTHWFRAVCWPRRIRNSRPAKLIRAWKTVIDFQASCRRFDAMLSAKSYMHTCPKAGTLWIPSGFVVSVKNTFLVLDLGIGEEATTKAGSVQERPHGAYPRPRDAVAGR